MTFIGTWQIDDLLSFYVNSHDPATGGAVDADAVPGYRIYEDEAYMNLTGSMALLDDANTVGFYSEQITVSAANGFEVGKCYAIRITVVVGGVTGVEIQTFQVEAVLTNASIAAAVAAPAAPAIADAVWDEVASGHVAVGTFGLAGQGVIRQNTAQAGGAASITLDAGASATASYYVGFYIAIVDGAGAGQLPRAITAYDGGTKVATVDPAWDTQPGVTSEFAIFT